MAQGISGSLIKKQEEEKLKKKGLGVLPTAVTARPAHEAGKTMMMPEPIVDNSPLQGETMAAHGTGIEALPESKPMPWEMRGATKHTAHGDFPAVAKPAGVPAVQAIAADTGNQVEAEPGAGAEVAGSGDGGVYAPEYPAAAGVPTAAAETEKGGLNRSAMLKALMVAGLTMMDKGGRATRMPVSATSVIGQGGLAGVQAYDQEKAIQQKEGVTDQAMERIGLNIQNEKVALQSANIDLGVKKKMNTILDRLAVETDPKKLADLTMRYNAMSGKAGTTKAMQQVKEKVQIGVDELGQPTYAEKTIGSFDTGTGAMSRFDETGGGKGVPGQQQVEVPTERTIALMKRNKGNKEYEADYIRRFGSLPEGY